MSIFGKDALDYIIAITLKSLHKYQKWLNKNGYAPEYSPTYNKLTMQAEPRQHMLPFVPVHFCTSSSMKFIWENDKWHSNMMWDTISSISCDSHIFVMSSERRPN